MNIVFLGPPGAGKGTQAAFVAAAQSVPHISTGDMFRAAIARKTPVGVQAKAYIDAGSLVPDEVTIALVRERLSEPDCQCGYLLDGFPRTVPQAEALEVIRAPERVINLSIPLARLTRRLSGRRSCSSCGLITHVDALDGKDVCNKCGSALVWREDDREEPIMARLRVYEEKTAPLIAFYHAKGKLFDVDADASVEEVAQRITAALGAKP